MIGYEHDEARKSDVAVFADGSRVSASRTRARAYPALDGAAPDTSEAYRMAIARLRDVATRVADLGAGSGAGTAALCAAGFDAVGIDESPEAVEFARRYAPRARFVRSSLDSCDVANYDAVLMMDVLGLLADDAATLRTIARKVQPGVRLVGAVARAEVGQSLAAPARRAFSAESLDALLVRTGWTAPVLLGVCEGMFVFETTRASGLETARAIELAEAARNSSNAESAMRLVAIAASRTGDASEARELLLALGRLQLDRGERELAEQSFTGANAVAPSCAAPYVALAAARLAVGDGDDAEALLDHALGLDPTNVSAWRDLAAIYAGRREVERAAECFECAASLAPSDAVVASELARLFARLGDGEGASRALERLLQFDGATDAVRASYGWLAFAPPSTSHHAAESSRREAVTTGVYPIAAAVAASTSHKSMAS